ncbi:MAG TPA: hypothetical protein VHW44_27830 [Pseudonocardiaceae bacterium]|jgi:hypothetical protein|nr:hypothetical protein [Pseudonocardiaceae bacterium]
MRFKWYAETPGRWLRQLFTDIIAVGWLVFWVWLAVQVHNHILAAAGPGNSLISAGTGLRTTFQNASDDAGKVPLIGHALADTLGGGTKIGSSLVTAGSGEVTLTHEVAFWLAVALVTGPIVLVLATWLPLRLRYARQAGAVAAMARSERHQELLALRALTTLSPNKLLTMGPTLMDGWRSGDRKVTNALVSAECARLGIRAGR